MTIDFGHFKFNGHFSHHRICRICSRSITEILVTILLVSYQLKQDRWAACRDMTKQIDVKSGGEIGIKPKTRKQTNKQKASKQTHLTSEEICIPIIV